MYGVLIHAIEYGNVYCAQLVIELMYSSEIKKGGQDINTKYFRGFTALSFAIINSCNLDMI